MMPSKGYMFSITMLLIIILEICLLTDVKPKLINTPIIIFFSLQLASLLTQLAGILMVFAGRYRAGGILQIAVGVFHLLDVTGFIGIIGGIIAYRYPEKLARPG